METANLIIVIENQNSFEKAKKLAEIVSEALEIKSAATIEKYGKLRSSYKLIFAVELNQNEDPVIQALRVTNKICTPWIVKFNEEQHAVELTFNNADDVLYRKQEFNVIIWAHWNVG